MAIISTTHIQLASLSKKLKDLGYQSSTFHRDSLLILQAITGKTDVELLSQKAIELSQEQTQKLNDWIFKLTHMQIPLQYLIGYVYFCDIKIHVETPILIPRPETEEMCDWITNLLKKDINKTKILDLCCGTGCIGIAIAKKLPHIEVICSDIDKQAICLTRKNKKINKINNVTVIQSNLFEKLGHHAPFDLIVANPPYISPQQWENLPNRVKNWESKKALYSEKEGLKLIEEIIKKAKTYLTTKKQNQTKSNMYQLVMEIDSSQKNIVANHLKENNYHSEFFKDMTGRIRWFAATLK